MSDNGAATKRKMEEILNQQKAKKTNSASKTTTQSVQDEKFADIENNTFFKVVTSDASPEEQKAQIAQLLTYDATQTKEQNVLRLKEFDLFKEFLQSERKKMAQKIISLTDTDAFAELKDVYEQINGAVLEFDNSMKPLIEIIDAVYNLRQKGGDVTLGVFKEIQEDKAAEEERALKQKELADKLAGIESSIRSNNNDIVALGEEKSFFGLGGVKKKARIEIALKQQEIAEKQAELANVAADLEKLKTPEDRASEFGDLATEKAKLRELLDISSDEHKERQKRLVASAQNFVNTTEERVSNVLGHYGKMEAQIEDLFNNNKDMQNIYAIVTEASADASKANKVKRDELGVKPETESAIQMMEREDKKLYIEDYITNMDTSAVDTARTFADLTSQSYRIKSMKDANREQVNKTRQLHSSGVAGVADRLSTVLQVVSGAALNESAEMASNTVQLMNGKTDVIAVQEAFRIAAGIKDVGNSLEKAIDNLKTYRDTAQVATATTIENLEVVKQNQAILNNIIKETQQAVKESFAVNADVNMQEVDAKATDTTKKAANTNSGGGKKLFGRG